MLICPNRCVAEISLEEHRVGAGAGLKFIVRVVGGVCVVPCIRSSSMCTTAAPGTAPTVIRRAWSRADRSAGANCPYSGSNPPMASNTSARIANASTSQARPLTGCAPASVDQVKPASADPAQEIALVVTDIEIPGLGGRVRRDPPRERLEAARGRQGVAFGKHDPSSAGARRARVPKRRVARARDPE